MIRSFRDKTTEAVSNGESPKGFPADLVKVARRKLRYYYCVTSFSATVAGLRRHSMDTSASV